MERINLFTLGWVFGLALAIGGPICSQGADLSGDPKTEISEKRDDVPRKFSVKENSNFGVLNDVFVSPLPLKPFPAKKPKKDFFIIDPYDLHPFSTPKPKPVNYVIPDPYPVNLFSIPVNNFIHDPYPVTPVSTKQPKLGK